MKTIHIRYFLLLLLGAFLSLQPLCAQNDSEEMNVYLYWGVVVDANGSPFFGAHIKDAKKAKDPEVKDLATTDFDGFFVVRSATKLAQFQIQALGQKTKVVRAIAGDTIRVVLEEDEDGTLLNEAVSTVKHRTKPKPRRAKAKIVGNTYCITFVVPVAKATKLKPNERFIAQPYVENPQKDRRTGLHPLILDNKEFHCTQNRMYNMDMMKNGVGDKFASVCANRQIYVLSETESTTMYVWHDTLWINNDCLNDAPSFRAEIVQGIESYTHIVDELDTTMVATGVSNPARWLEYTIPPYHLTDSMFIPLAQEMDMATQKEINLNFEVGKTTISQADPNNAAEIEKFRKLIADLQHHGDLQFTKLATHGVSSPEGSYQKNKELGAGRAIETLNFLLNEIPSRLRRDTETESTSEVAEWKKVAELMRKDSLVAQAEEIERICASQSDIDAQGRIIRGLPFYNTLIKDNYLPRLRSVKYAMTYTVKRNLTDEEIHQWYQDEKKRKNLMAYEWYRLFLSETDTLKKEQYCREAYQKYPGMVLFANELQCILIEKKKTEPKLLFSFVERIKAMPKYKRRPYFPLIQNHITACLMNHELDSIAANVAYLEKNDETELILAVCDVINGYYKEALPVLARTSDRNRFILLMALSNEEEESEEDRKRYAEEALEVARTFPEDQALSHYFLAMAWFRQLNSIEDDAIENDINGYVSNAEEEIKKAFKMDESLKKQAIFDADVNRIPYVQKLANDHFAAEREAKEAAAAAAAQKEALPTTPETAPASQETPQDTQATPQDTQTTQEPITQ